MKGNDVLYIRFLLALICGVARNDATAAFFFQAAVEQGLEAARRMLKVVGSPAAEVPECLREPTSPAAEPALPALPLPRVDYRAIAPRKIFHLVMKLAPQFKVAPQLALAIIAAESNFNSLAVSVKGAQG